MFTATLNLVTRVGLPYFFGTLKDESLLINILVSNNCFSSETSSKMASTLCQKQLTLFCQKAQIFF